MKLLLLTFALLLEQSYGQAVIDRDTDLLALPTNLDEIPYGEKLPGYRKAAYAFSYTIPNDSGDQDESSEADDELSSILTEPVLHLQSPNTKKTALAKESSYTSSFQSKEENENQFQNHASPPSHQYGPPPPEQEYLPPSQPNKPSLSLEYLPPKESVLQTYLPPVEVHKPPVSVDYLPPDPVIHQQYLPPHTTASPFISVEYLPPKQEIPQEKFPPSSSEVPFVILDYLPPLHSNVNGTSINILDTYIPPLLTTHIQPPVLEYLPPVNKAPPKINTKEPVDLEVPFTSYLPPIEINLVPPDSQNVNYNVGRPIGITQNVQEHPVALHGLIENEVIIKNKIHGHSNVSVLIGDHGDALILPVVDHKLHGPASLTGQTVDAPIQVHSQTKPHQPSGLVGFDVSPIITADKLMHAQPPVTLVGEHVHDSIHLQKEHRPLSPAAVVGHTINKIIHADQDKDALDPVALIGDSIHSPIFAHQEIQKQIPLVISGQDVGKKIHATSTAQLEKPVAVQGSHIGQPIFPLQGSRPASSLAATSVVVDVLTPLKNETPTASSVFRPHNKNKITAGHTPTDFQNAVLEHPAKHECNANLHCRDDELCMDSYCLHGCSIIKNVCVGNAFCECRKHIPACKCPAMFTAVTVSTRGQEQYDCIPMMMMNTANSQFPGFISALASSHTRPFFVSPHHRPGPSVPFDRRPIADVRRPISRITSSGGFGGAGADTFSGTGNACVPSPCGPSTRCEVNSRGIALCRCLEGFVPDGNTINGCKPQCTSDFDCPDDYLCRSTKCVRACQPGACGLNADCDARNHQAVCKCPTGYAGNPNIRCSRVQPEVRVAPPAPPLDPCDPNPCGVSAECRARGERPVCSCPVGYEGDPLTHCRRGECIRHEDCPSHLACQNLRCIDPCQGVCGTGSECVTRNHQPICSCPSGYTGNPFTACRRFDPRELCEPSPCGPGTTCTVRGNRAVCSCLPNYIGNPLVECRPECISDQDCPSNLACRDNRCRNPCIDGCGENAICNVRNNRAVCSCPEFYMGDPHTRCFPECVAHEDCPTYQACFQLRCIDPCVGACGTGADCRVDNHKPICSCPRGYTGHPFEACRPFTREDLCRDNPCGTNADCNPGFDRDGNDRPVCTCPTGYIGNPLVSCQKGECERHEDCQDNKACYQYMCESPCFVNGISVCGENAHCEVRNHRPVCSCPRGYEGNPLTRCDIRSSSRFTVGRSKK